MTTQHQPSELRRFTPRCVSTCTRVIVREGPDPLATVAVLHGGTGTVPGWVRWCRAPAVCSPSTGVAMTTGICCGDRGTWIWNCWPVTAVNATQCVSHAIAHPWGSGYQHGGRQGSRGQTQPGSTVVVPSLTPGGTCTCSMNPSVVCTVITAPAPTPVGHVTNIISATGACRASAGATRGIVVLLSSSRRRGDSRWMAGRMAGAQRAAAAASSQEELILLKYA
jgi:hypothetical protein